MKNNYAPKISKDLKISHKQVENTIELLEADSTVPFIARYRKEVTGGLDEVQIIAIRDNLQVLKDLNKRSLAIIKSLKETKHYTDDLAKAIAAADTMVKLEDIYLPYKPKRKTRASIAKEKGLEPLAQMLLSGQYKSISDCTCSDVPKSSSMPTAIFLKSMPEIVFNEFKISFFPFTSSLDFIPCEIDNEASTKALSLSHCLRAKPSIALYLSSL